MAAVDYFIKFDGIKGESADAKHKDEIDVRVLELRGRRNTDRRGAAAAAAPARSAMQDFHFTIS